MKLVFIARRRGRGGGGGGLTASLLYYEFINRVYNFYLIGHLWSPSLVVEELLWESHVVGWVSHDPFFQFKCLAFWFGFCKKCLSANVWDIKYSPSKKPKIWNYIFDCHSRSQKNRCRPYKFLLKNYFWFSTNTKIYLVEIYIFKFINF